MSTNLNTYIDRGVTIIEGRPGAGKSTRLASIRLDARHEEVPVVEISAANATLPHIRKALKDAPNNAVVTIDDVRTGYCEAPAFSIFQIAVREARRGLDVVMAVES